MESEDFELSTKYGSIKTKLESREVGIILLIIVFTLVIPFCKYVSLDEYYIGIFLLFILVLLWIFLRSTFRIYNMSNMLNSAYDLSIKLDEIKNRYGRGKPEEEIKILKSLYDNYEACYFQSYIYGTPALSVALKRKMDELKNDISVTKEGINHDRR